MPFLYISENEKANYENALIYILLSKEIMQAPWSYDYMLGSVLPNWH